MSIKIFSWRHNIRLFLGAILILGFIPGSVHAFSDEVPPDSVISDEPTPTPETENKDPEEETETPIVRPETIAPPENSPQPNIDTPGDTPGETPGESPGDITPNPVNPTPTIEAGPDINQPNLLETTAETEGETAVEIPGETSQEPTLTTTEETPGDGGQSTSGPSINPPIDSPTLEFGFSPDQPTTGNDIGDIIDISSPLGELGISVGESGFQGGAGESAVENIQNIVAGASINSENLNTLVQGLLEILGAPSREIAEQLVRSLLGLIKDGKVDPKRLWASVNAYNAFIEASSPEFLENPPIELVMIRAILSDLVEAAIAADIRSRN
ncbi:hypothetical protein [Laspinema olomoucense]|uniref:Uncharacterized protein n=1 Tax=Laspinema olomoucense D3b TaxID=2953688 RepID=A0ABT2N751_9CYAN|nr:MULTISPECIES: hypothetical protein [unclassified Laspinema]MCT7971727.1 hypothetical protein [Laspinema sp. D3d]MCT7977210.1 hypothetical protein [Laspinema sp. D3b]